MTFFSCLSCVTHFLRVPFQPDQHGLIFLNIKSQPDETIRGKNTQGGNGNEKIILFITLRIHLALPPHDVTTSHALRSNQPSSCSEADRGQGWQGKATQSVLMHSHVPRSGNGYERATAGFVGSANTQRLDAHHSVSIVRER